MRDDYHFIQHSLLSQEYEKTKGKTCGLFVDLYKRLVEDSSERRMLFTIASW